MNASRKLIAARGEKTRREVSKAIGISVSAIAMYENGLRTPRDAIKQKLADYYGLTVQDLFFTHSCHEK